MKKLYITILTAAAIILFGIFLTKMEKPVNAPGAQTGMGVDTPAEITVETITGVVEQEEFSEVKYGYPVFSGLKDKAVEDKINVDIRDTIVQAAEGNKGQFAEVCGEVEPLDGWQCRFAYDEEYKSFTQLSDRILSVHLETYMYTGGAHGGMVTEYINYDLKTGERFAWQSVFVAGSDYLGAVAKFANADIKRQLLIGEDSMTEEEWIDKGSAATAENYGDGNVGFDENGLIVVFQQYQVAAYAQGAVTSLIPYGELEGVIDGKGLLGR